ncbi:hypothetical protein M9H77_08482 [Catharanthus roseus]|uniref:Uncharacterized protein n=1 Tax=Catharanthus roseus TaxID=4058 RepID=A0ACC0BY50_CATRO|nr:hypothetical protein M9H77_08482 [Catharanthus roseus]
MLEDLLLDIAIIECANKLPPNSQDHVAVNDSFAQVIGDERNYRVRMMGLGKIGCMILRARRTISKARGENGEYAIYDAKPQSKWITNEH